MKLSEIVLSILSGTLLILIFPNFNLETLAWVGFIPLFWAIRKKSPSKAAFLGWISGFTFFTGVLPWIYHVLAHFGHLPAPVSVFFLLVLTAYLALFFSAFAFALRWFNTRMNVSETLLAAPLWVSLEYLRGILFSGFPWALLGYSQFLTLPMVQIADVTGVYGVSFLVMFVNAVLYRSLQVFGEQKTFRPLLKEILAAALLFALTGIYGHFRIQEMDSRGKEGTPLRVALIQGNIPQDIKWEPKFQEETMKIYVDLTLQVDPAHPRMIIWPETATPFFFQEAFSFQSRIFDLAHRMNAPLLFGSPAYDRKGAETLYYNSAFLISPERKVLGRYDKIHLVPFGEYAPLSGILGFTRDIIGALGDFQSGQEVVNLSVPQGKFGVLICYEAIFPELTRQFVKKGAQFLVNITNDAWFGETAAPFQHISMAMLRAIENRVPLVRAANTGVSGVIDPVGRLLHSSQIFTKAALSDTIYLRKSWSFYAQFGDIFTYLCLGYTALLLMISYLKGNNRVERSRE